MNIETWYESAMKFAQKKHEGQIDDEGKDYFKAHVWQVFKILYTVCYDRDIIIAGLLHDTIEDTATTYNELVEHFGQRVADLVMEVTHEGKKDSKGYYFPRLRSKGAIMIKFADRLSNLSRMEGWEADRQKQYLKRSKFWKSE
jgi:(p)ppGpp synthase/HD superfamily hydrolase